MNLLNGDKFRGRVAMVSAVLVFSLGLRLAHAVDTDTQNASQQASETDQAPANANDKSTTDQPSAETPTAPAAPRLQLQDEGPSPRDSDSDRLSHRRMTAADDTDERPFWKHWIFWTVTGALIVGAVSMAIYASSGADASLAPCPPDVVVSLGCFGMGR